jgi:putative flippase GtrA
MRLSRRVVLFVLSGAVAALANMGSRLAFSMAFSYPVAIVLAYCVGMVVAFVLFRHTVFDGGSGKGLGREILWFVVINALALLQTLAVSIILADTLLPFVGWTWRGRDVAHVAGVLFPVFTSYFGHKHLTFGRGRVCV